MSGWFYVRNDRTPIVPARTHKQIGVSIQFSPVCRLIPMAGLYINSPTPSEGSMRTSWPALRNPQRSGFCPTTHNQPARHDLESGRESPDLEVELRE